MKTLSIHLSTGYPIYIDNHLLDGPLLAEYCKKINNRTVIITDSHLINTLGKNVQSRLLERGITVELLAFPAGEKYKTRETKQRLEDELLLKKYGRDTTLIALGGGVVTDLVGFLAATYCRGLPVIYIPTTLLAMVDASIGGKTAVNTPHGKNLVGSFTQPHTVLIDINTLDTLPEKEWCNGMTEMLKHAIIADNILFKILKKNSHLIKQRDINFLIEMIYASCSIKKNIVEQDEQEQGIRQLLNFGHTIGHVIETIENYHISHGEAVAIGMLVESYLSIQCGYLHKNSFKMLEKTLHDYGLPLQTSAFQHQDVIKQLLMLDKKSLKNTAHFVLLDKIGQAHRHHDNYTISVDPAHFKQTMIWAAEYFKPKYQ